MRLKWSHPRPPQSMSKRRSEAMRQRQLSARASHRLLKLARTTTDLAGAGQTEPAHIVEAVQYCP
ncbi:MAG: hypothetical protein IT304_13255 [Dehalococcoidia bacterium]|nr:hypothetical protein [Dehalococcoidia bacterium]